MRLSALGWNVPSKDRDGIFNSKEIDEDQISFPSEGYTGEASNSEASGFWARERANSIYDLLKANGVKTLWEIGAGNGNAAIPLRDRGIEVLPIEPLRSGALTLSKNGFTTFCATLEDLSFPDNSIEAIGAFDVLEHLEDPAIVLREIHRVLVPGGIFVCSVPAYQWLFSDFDLSIGHYRRYSRKSLSSQLNFSNFRITHESALFAFLLVPAFILRRIPFLLGRRANLIDVKKSAGGNSSIMNKLEWILIGVNRLERRLHLPIGLTLLCVARKS
jgi:SAM-dependent methyltransferase